MSLFRKLTIYAETLVRLGVLNVVYVAWHRFSLRTGIKRFSFPQRKMEPGDDFFMPSKKIRDYPDLYSERLLADAQRIISGTIRYFLFHWKDTGSPPEWFRNPFSSRVYHGSGLHWTMLPDFQREAGDIKIIWEPSRFEWMVTLARAAAVTGDKTYLETINQWLADWCHKNPLNTGPNWKCGQEASVRVFNLVNSSWILGQWEDTMPDLQYLVYIHIERISSNIGYAIAQNNNHGTSEAAALFIGANWLIRNGHGGSKLQYFARRGRSLLENRVRVLIAGDGGFSQHSVNYHRVLLDTLTFAEFWRQTLELPGFSTTFYERAGAAIRWIHLLTDEKSHGCPNLGANDGSMLLNIHSCDYMDFRPSIQTASVIFENRRVFKDGLWDEPLLWFRRDPEKYRVEVIQRKSMLLPSGYLVIKSTGSWGMLRLPGFRFRPSQCDIFHFDLWYNGQNIVPDSGTYSYYSDGDDDTPNMKSVHFHNTISFDGREQMHELGRFLYGGWIEPLFLGDTAGLTGEVQAWAGAYSDHRGNFHRRSVTVNGDEWIITDEVSGKFGRALSGFNFISSGYEVAGRSVITSWGRIEVKGNAPFQVTDSEVSLYYYDKDKVNRLNIIMEQPQKVSVIFIPGK